jgi:hypothetical protein
MYNLISLFSLGILISGLVNMASDYRWGLLLNRQKIGGLVGHWGGIWEALEQEDCKPWRKSPG